MTGLQATVWRRLSGPTGTDFVCMRDAWEQKSRWLRAAWSKRGVLWRGPRHESGRWSVASKLASFQCCSWAASKAQLSKLWYILIIACSNLIASLSVRVGHEPEKVIEIQVKHRYFHLILFGIKLLPGHFRSHHSGGSRRRRLKNGRRKLVGDFFKHWKRRGFFGAELLPTSKKSQQGEDDGTWKLAHIMRYNTLKLNSVGMTHLLGRLLGLRGAIWDDEDINCKDLVIVFCVLWHLQCSPLTSPS